MQGKGGKPHTAGVWTTNSPVSVLAGDRGARAGGEQAGTMKERLPRLLFSAEGGGLLRLVTIRGVTSGDQASDACSGVKGAVRREATHHSERVSQGGQDVLYLSLDSSCP